jgi:RND family efflux transporter MFP subunit
VQPGEPIVTLQQIAPILVNFSLPERHYGELARGQPIEVRVDAYPQRSFAGAVSAISPRVDRQTRNFLVQGWLPNDERRLRPGMFANITVTLPDRRQVVTVPATAISYSPSGDSVFLVQQPDPAAAGSSAEEPAAPITVTRVLVETGERRGTQIAVLDGIEPGDLAVTAGQLKLFEGAPVSVLSEDVLPNASRTASRR